MYAIAATQLMVATISSSAKSVVQTRLPSLSDPSRASRSLDPSKWYHCTLPGSIFLADHWMDVYRWAECMWWCLGPRCPLSRHSIAHWQALVPCSEVSPELSSLNSILYHNELRSQSRSTWPWYRWTHGPWYAAHIECFLVSDHDAWVSSCASSWGQVVVNWQPLVSRFQTVSVAGSWTVGFGEDYLQWLAQQRYSSDHRPLAGHICV